MNILISVFFLSLVLISEAAFAGTVSDEDKKIWIARIEATENKGAIDRITAMEKVAWNNVREAIPSLLKVVQDEAEVRNIRYTGIKALGGLRAEEAIPFLEKIILSRKPGERQSSWDLDTYIGYAIPALAQILEEVPVFNSWELLINTFLRRAELDLDDVQRSLLIRSMGTIKANKEVEQQLLNLLDLYPQISVPTRTATVWSLQEIGDLKTVESLETWLRLKNPDKDLRESVGEAIIKIQKREIARLQSIVSSCEALMKK